MWPYVLVGVGLGALIHGWVPADFFARYAGPDNPFAGGNVFINPGEIPGNGIDDDGNGYVDDVHGWDFANNDDDPFDDNLSQVFGSRPRVVIVGVTLVAIALGIAVTAATAAALIRGSKMAANSVPYPPCEWPMHPIR